MRRPTMLKAARRRLRPLDNVKLKQAELSAVPLADATCDVAFCILALGYTENPAAVVAEMRRLLKPGGRAIIVDVLAHDRDDFRRRMGQRHRGFAIDETRQLLRDFADVRIQPLPPEPDAKGPALFVASGGRRMDEKPTLDYGSEKQDVLGTRRKYCRSSMSTCSRPSRKGAGFEIAITIISSHLRLSGSQRSSSESSFSTASREREVWTLTFLLQSSSSFLSENI